MIAYAWRSPVSDDEMVDLVRSHGGDAVPGWWDRIRPFSLGWIAARTPDGLLVGFDNIAWDGGDHAFLLDTKTRGSHQRRGIATEVVREAVVHAEAAGCEWLHVDFEPESSPRSTWTRAASGRPTPAWSTCRRSRREAE